MSYTSSSNTAHPTQLKGPTHGQLAQAWKTYGGEQESEPQTFAQCIMIIWRPDLSDVME